MPADDASQVELLQALLRLFDPLEWQKKPKSIRDQFAAFDAARRAERDAAVSIAKPGGQDRPRDSRARAHILSSQSRK